MSWVVVVFPERREVFVDDESEGSNIEGAGAFRALLIGEGPHVFRLGGEANYTPAAQTVNVPDASLVDPFRVVFQKTT